MPGGAKFALSLHCRIRRWTLANTISAEPRFNDRFGIGNYLRGILWVARPTYFRNRSNHSRAKACGFLEPYELLEEPRTFTARAGIARGEGSGRALECALHRGSTSTTAWQRRLPPPSPAGDDHVLRIGSTPS